MDAGAVVASGTLGELQAQHGSSGLEIELEGDDAMLDAAAAAAGAVRDGQTLRLESRPAWAPVIAAIEATGARIKRLGSRRTDLETVFLGLTGRRLRDA
jgi:ABC-type multidrug transport system ATPase subunit